MEIEFIPYEEALALKNLGFNEACLGGYDKGLYWFYHPDSDITVDAPLYQQAFRWFREKYDLLGFIDAEGENSYYYMVTNIKEEDVEECVKEFKTYEEAELACLRKLIKIVKNKG